MTNKKVKEKPEQDVFSKASILASNRYANRRDLVTAVLPDDFSGTLNDVDALLDKFLKGKVK